MSNLPERRRGPGRQSLSRRDELTPFITSFDDLMRGVTEVGPFVPRVELQETDDRYVVNAEAPGMKPSDIDVEVRGNDLIISGERCEERDESQGRQHFTECSYGSFQRVITLPEAINAEQVQAQCADGIVRISIPKANPTRHAKIPISDSRGQDTSKMSASAQPQMSQGSEPQQTKQQNFGESSTEKLQETPVH